MQIMKMEKKLNLSLNIINYKNEFYLKYKFILIDKLIN